MIESIKRSPAFRALGSRDCLMLLELLDIANAPRLASPRIVHGFVRRDALAERVGRSISSVGRSLRNLRASGWIMTIKGGWEHSHLGLAFCVFPAPHAKVRDG